MIPDHLDLTYSKHAIRERTRDKFGCIEYVPRHFYKVGCKEVIEDNTNLKVKYIYNDKLDLVLIISPEGLVITNYLIAANNEKISKGRFRFSFAK